MRQLLGAVLAGLVLALAAAVPAHAAGPAGPAGTRAPAVTGAPAACPMMVARAAGVTPDVIVPCPHPRCSGPTCVGKDPQTLGCGGSNARDLASVLAPGGGASIVLRWSDWCTANWADISMDWPDDWYVQTADGRIERWSGDGNWTFMVDGTQFARACVQGYGYANYACTAWF